MATFTKLKSGSWRVQVRRKGRYVSETFLRREDARRWATESEGKIDRGGTPVASRIARLSTFRELIDLHIDDMKEVGRNIGRSKAASLAINVLNIADSSPPFYETALGTGYDPANANPLGRVVSFQLIKRW